MDTFEEIADERLELAELLSGLTVEQLSAPSLCSDWNVRDVATHLIVPLEVSIPRFMVDWAHGTGAAVSGDAEALLLAMTGRPVALQHLDGDGVAMLRRRLS